MFVNLRRRRARRSTRWSSYQRVADIVRKNPDVDSFMADVGGGGSGGRANSGAPDGAAYAARAANAVAPQQIAQQLRAAAAAVPGLPRVRQPAAVAPDRRPHGQPELQPHGSEPEHRRALRVGAEARGSDRRSVPEMQDVVERPGDAEPARQPRIDRDKAAAVGLNATADPERAVRRGSGRSGRPRSTATRPSTACCSSSIRNIRSRPTRCAKISFKTPQRRAGAARVGGRLQGDGRTAERSTTPASFRRSRSPSACGRASRSARATAHVKQVADRAAAGDDHRRASRASAQGLPAVDEEPRAAARSSPSASSTSCWACSTRATSTR